MKLNSAIFLRMMNLWLLFRTTLYPLLYVSVKNNVITEETVPQQSLKFNPLRLNLKVPIENITSIENQINTNSAQINSSILSQNLSVVLLECLFIGLLTTMMMYPSNKFYINTKDKWYIIFTVCYFQYCLHLQASRWIQIKYTWTAAFWGFFILYHWINWILSPS